MAKKVLYKFDPFKEAGITRRGLTKGQQDVILEEVAEFLLDKTNQFLDDSRSPVSGQRGFRNLKDGGRSILEDTGEMRDAMFVEKSGNQLIHSVSAEEQGKADNHNKFSAASKRTPVPRRQFIPNRSEKQTYKKEILKGIREVMDDLIKEFKEDG